MIVTAPENVCDPLTVKVPTPFFVTPPAPDITSVPIFTSFDPSVVNRNPALLMVPVIEISPDVASISVADPKTIALSKETAVEEELVIAPLEETPEPLIVIILALELDNEYPLKSKVAPLETNTPPFEAEQSPSGPVVPAPVRPSFKVPLVILYPPKLSLIPDINIVPLPDLAIDSFAFVPESVILPLNVVLELSPPQVSVLTAEAVLKSIIPVDTPPSVIEPTVSSKLFKSKVPIIVTELASGITPAAPNFNFDPDPTVVVPP